MDTAIGARIRARWRPAGASYAAFVRKVEPDLLGRGHLHRFAVPPIPLEAPGAPAAVRFTGSGDHYSADDSVRAQTLAPAADDAEWSVLVDPGYVLHREAVRQFARATAVGGDVSVVTCDHDELDRHGRRSRPSLHPGPSPDLLASAAAPTPVMAVRTALLAGNATVAPGWRRALLAGTIGRSGHGHAHLPLILGHGRRGVPGSPADEMTRAPSPPAGHAREPSVEVIVCLRDQPARLERCVASLLSRTAYERVRLRLVDNGSRQTETAELLDRLARDRRVTVGRDPRPFNFSALNHMAAQRSDADVLVFLNNDTEVVDSDWIDVLLSAALRADVGAVAPLLTYPDGRVQHAGVAVGLHGWAGHPFAGLQPDQRTPFGSASDGTRNWLAVTAACLMVERRKYMEVGGFDESFQVGGGDVDLCLRLTAAGYRSLCMPRTRVIHDESATRDPTQIPRGDFEASRRSYGAFRTVGDPFYHPALTLQDTSCRLRGPGEPPA